MARRIRTTTTRRTGVREHLERRWQAKIDRLHPHKDDELPSPYPRLLAALRAGKPVPVVAFAIRDYLPSTTDPLTLWIVNPDESVTPHPRRAL